MGILDKLKGGTPEERAAKAAERAQIEAALGAARAQQQALQQAARVQAEQQRAAAAQLAEKQRQEAYARWALGDELFEVDVQTPADAKYAIKLARLRKRELQAAKRDLSTHAAEERERWRDRQAGRYSTTGMGRGTTARVIRSGIQSSRRAERQEHADRLNVVSDQKQEFDRAIAVVDRLLIDLERQAARG